MKFSKMVVWSRFGLNNIAKSTIAFRCAHKVKIWNDTPVRNCHERTLLIRWSRFSVKKAKDAVILYSLLGILPFAAIVTYVNLYIGPATLALIPEGYEPKPWEYYRHPITRFFARYIVPSPQETYERNMHNIFVKSEKQQLHHLKKKIENMIKEKQDYQSWYFEKPVVKYVRKFKEEEKEPKIRNIIGGWMQ